jgi:shikimate kinase
MLHQTVTLIGMPGAGKSTVGVLLAKRIGLNFVDSDLLIQVREGETLQSLVDRRGYLELRRIEEIVLLEMALDAALVATGGSAVYSEASMSRLQTAGPVVYLRGSLPVLEERVRSNLLRGIAAPPGQDFAAIYEERTPLYARFADITASVDAGSAEAIAAGIATELGYR